MIERDDELVLYPDIADAYVGIVERFGQPPIACYDYDRVIALYMAQGMDEEEAVEFFEYNTIGTWAGECTPCFIRTGVDPEEFA